MDMGSIERLVLDQSRSPGPEGGTLRRFNITMDTSCARTYLTQIKTLITPPEAYPLLRCCCDTKDAICVIRDNAVFSDEQIV